MLHYGQGKWYPGESLPRWALGCYWRKDGVPIWKDDSLIADESKDYGFGPREAKELASRIAANLGVESQWLLPAYEDVFYYTWKERRLPSNVTPEKSNLKNKEERDRLAQIFQKGLGAVAGYALPLKRNRLGEEPLWLSGPWFLREEVFDVADSRRLADGSSPAHGFSSLGGGKRVSAALSARPRSENAAAARRVSLWRARRPAFRGRRRRALAGRLRPGTARAKTSG